VLGNRLHEAVTGDMDTKCYAGARENQVALDPEWLQSRVRAEPWDVFNEEQMCAAVSDGFGLRYGDRIATWCPSTI